MIKIPSSVWVLTGFLLVTPISPGAVKKQAHPVPADHLPFKPGEKLTYEVSWSSLIQAGTAVMEVREEKGTDGKNLYHLVSTARSGKFLSKFYTVSDTIESVIDEKKLYPLSYRLDQTHGKRHKKREMIFNHDDRSVAVLADGQRNVYPVPEDIQDPLSIVYYVRTKKNFVVGKPFIVNIHEDGKNWAVEVQVLGKEKMKTALGEVNTIELKTYPKYEGVFQNKGEIYIWLTDDERKIPVVMKSTISIGSIVTTLVDFQSGDVKK